MPTGVEHAQEIMQDLACPACQYNLRGLRGTIVACPECGARSDVARLMQARWRMPWRKAPGYNRLAWPLAGLLIGGLPTFIHHLAHVSLFVQTPPRVYVITSTGVVITLAGWALLLLRTHHRDGGTDAVLKSLQAHAAYLSYMLGVVLVLVTAGSGLEFLGSLLIRRPAVTITAGVVALIAGMGAAVFCALGYRGERAIGHWCIRRYIASQGGTDAIAPATVTVMPGEALVKALPPLTPALRRYMDRVDPPPN